MAYVVLARKYRPQRFADLVGQEHVTRTLGNAIAHDRVHHAYLFCGARGLGKTTAARILAKCLVCERGPTIEPCNECRECTAVNAGNSVDVIEIDGASNNRVDDVRNLREQVRYLPQTARKRIYIIDEVHMLTGSAFNALLKTLEEPPPHVTFILATTEVHELPATILSRVSRFDFRRVASRQLVDHMTSILESEEVRIAEAGLYTIARAGDGSVRDTLTLLDKIIAFASGSEQVGEQEVRTVLGVPARLVVADMVDAVLARDAEKTLRLFDEVVESGQDLQQLALTFLQHIRDLVVVKVCGVRDVLRDMSDTQYEQLEQQAAAASSAVLSQIFDRFAQTVDSLPRTRVPRLIMEMGLLDLVHSDPLIPLGDLVARLDQFEGQRGRGQPPSGGRPTSGGHGRGRPGPSGQGARQANTRASNAISRDTSQRGSSPRTTPSGAIETPRAKPNPPASARDDARTDSKSRFWRILEGKDRSPGRTPEHQSTTPPGPISPSTPRSVPPTQTRAPDSRHARTGSSSGSQAGAQANTRADDEPEPRPGPPRPEEMPPEWISTAAFDAWEAFLVRLGAADKPLAAVLSDCAMVHFSAERVGIATTRDGFKRRQLTPGSDLYRSFEHALARHFGGSRGSEQTTRIELIEDEPRLPELPSLVLVHERRDLLLRARVRQEAESKPEIQRLLTDFDGELQQVEPLARA